MTDEDGNLLFHIVLDDRLVVTCRVEREALEDWAAAHRSPLTDWEEIGLAAGDDIHRVADRKIAAEEFDDNGVVWITSEELNG